MRMKTSSRMKMRPTRATTTAPGQAAPPAPVSKQYDGPHIAEIKVIGKGVKAHYKLGTRGGRVVASPRAGLGYMVN